MPRQAREKSESGIYHIMLRGINQQQIFYDDEDCERFLEVLNQEKHSCGFELFAFCFMGNHLHLLLREKSEPIGLIFKKIGSKYVYWYNAKYQRTGHLFQDRYKSLPIEDDAYFLSALRYIHNNPVKAGLVCEPNDYRFSSYHYYFEKQFLIDCNYVWKMISKEQFRQFHLQTDTYSHLELEEKMRHIFTDEQAKTIINRICHCDSVADFQKLEYQKQKSLIGDFRKAGISIRQISRLTGLPKGVVERNG